MRNDPRFSNTTGILPKKKTMWFISVEVEQETSATPAKNNPVSAPVKLVAQNQLCFGQTSNTIILCRDHT